jgi:hypothetical protein
MAALSTAPLKEQQRQRALVVTSTDGRSEVCTAPVCAALRLSLWWWFEDTESQLTAPERPFMFNLFTSANRPTHLHLSPGELLTFTPTHTTSLHLRSGVLWVTQTGDDRDHFLKAGQTMQLAPHRVTVLQAQDDRVNACFAPMVNNTYTKRPWRFLPKPGGSGHPFSI